MFDLTGQFTYWISNLDSGFFLNFHISTIKSRILNIVFWISNLECAFLAFVENTIFIQYHWVIGDRFIGTNLQTPIFNSYISEGKQAHWFIYALKQNLKVYSPSFILIILSGLKALCQVGEAFAILHVPHYDRQPSYVSLFFV